MTPELLENWFRSIEHQFGTLKCTALACNLLHQSLMINLSELHPSTAADVHRTIDAFETFYEGRTFREGVFQWLKAYESQTSQLNYDFTVETKIASAANYLLKTMLYIPTRDKVPAWQRSVLYSMDALNLPVMNFMTDVEFFLEHLEE